MPADYRQYPFPKGHHPRGWAETTVGEVLVEIQSGFSSGKHNQAGEGIPHLRPMSVSPFGDITLEGVRYISSDTGILRLADSDVLFTNTSSTLWVGKTAVVRKPIDWAFSNHMTRLRVGTGMDPEFVARQLHYLCMCGYFAFHCNKHINQSSIAPTQLAERVPFRCPPANEQSRIAKKLTRLLNRECSVRKALEALLGLTGQYRAAVLQAAYTGRLVPNDAELARKEKREYEPATVLLERILRERRAQWEACQEVKVRAAGKKPKDDKWKARYREPSPPSTLEESELPAGWVNVTLNQLSWAAGYGTSTKCTYEAAGPPVLRIPNIQPGRISLTDLKRARDGEAVADEDPLKAGDLVLIRTNGSRSFVGVAALVAEDFREPHYFASYLIRFRLVAAAFEPTWVSTIWHAPQMRERVLSMAISTAGQYNVNLGNLSELIIPLPPLNEQKRILAEIKRCLSAIDRIEEEVANALKQTADLRISLFQQAISGRLVTQHESDKPASELLSQIRVEREAKAAEAKLQKPQRKKSMKKLSGQLVKEAIRQLPHDYFTFADLFAALRADYEPLKTIIFELLAEASPCVRQVFDTKAKAMYFQRISS